MYHNYKDILVDIFSFSMESSNILFCLVTQRIAEIAGVVVSFDPKPIPVCLTNLFFCQLVSEGCAFN
jgi:hypothetical protein